MAPMMIPGLFSIYPQTPVAQQPEQQVLQSAPSAITSPDGGLVQQPYSQPSAPIPTAPHVLQPVSDSLLTQLIQQLPRHNGHPPPSQPDSRQQAEAPVHQQTMEVEMTAIHSEKEEGELSEGQEVSMLDAQNDGNIHNGAADVPGTNRINEVKGTSTSKADRKERRRQRQVAKEQSRAKQPADATQQTSRDLSAERAKAKNFILAWQRNGYSFAQLVQEGLDPHFLQPIYHELGISIGTSTTAPNGHGKAVNEKESTANTGVTASINQSGQRQQPTSTQGALVNAVAEKSPAAVIKASNAVVDVSPSPKVAMLDRKEYIAKLLAAKVKRSTTSAQDTAAAGVADLTHSDQKSPSVDVDKDATLISTPASAVSAPVVVTSPAAATVTDTTVAQTKASTTAESALIAAKRRAQTELARLRLQALASTRAANTAKVNADVTTSRADSIEEAPKEQPSAELGPEQRLPDIENGSPPEEGEIQDSSDDVVIPDAVDEPAAEAVAGPSQASDLALRFSSAPPSDHIPSDTVGSEMAVPKPHSLVVDPTPRAQHRKRPVASDFDGGPPAKLAKRPFGDMPGTPSFEDSMVIEVSDDESVDGGSSSKQRTTQPTQSNTSMLDIEYDAQVEAARKEEELKARRREEDIEKMKRRIAELEAKRKAKAALASRPGTPATPLVTERSSVPSTVVRTPVSQIQHISEPRPIRPQIPAVIDLTSSSNQSPIGSPLPQSAPSAASLDTSKRRDEIHLRLPQLEANHATSQSRLAALRAQIEAVQKEIRKEQEEKATLVAELEALGIDTENMPHAELQAVKEQVEAQKTLVAAEIEGLQEAPTSDREMDQALNKVEGIDTAQADDAENTESAHSGVPSLDGNIDDTPVASFTNEDTEMAEVQDKVTEEAFINRSDSSVDVEGSESGEIVSDSAPSTSSDRRPDIIEDVASSKAHLATHLTHPVNMSHHIAHLLADPQKEFYSDKRLYLIYPRNDDRCTADAIRQLCKPFRVADVCILKHPQSDVALGCAFVTLVNEQHARSAVAQIQNGKKKGPLGQATARLERHIKKKERSRVRRLLTEASQSDAVVAPKPHARDRKETQDVQDNGKLLFPSSSDLDRTLSALFANSTGNSEPTVAPTELSEVVTSEVVDVGDDGQASQSVAPFEPNSKMATPQGSSFAGPDFSRGEDLAVNDQTQEPPLQDAAPISDSQIAEPATVQSELSSAVMSPNVADAPTSDDSAMDLDSESESDYEPPEVNAPIPQPNATNSTEPQIINMTDELTIADSQPGVRLDEPAEVEGADSSHFTPYISPLSMFKGYRHHPSYATEVAGGIRSATYSNLIDAEKQFCPFELAGGVCNDPTCQYQHFKDTVASDEEIIRQLGVANIGCTDEERKLYRQGLLDTIKRIRAQGLNDPSAVTQALMDYRRDFLNDPTKVLSLNVDV